MIILAGGRRLKVLTVCGRAEDLVAGVGLSPLALAFAGAALELAALALARSAEGSAKLVGRSTAVAGLLRLWCGTTRSGERNGLRRLERAAVTGDVAGAALESGSARDVRLKRAESC